MSARKILSWNLNGLRSAATKGLVELVAEISPEIICFQEIKCNDFDFLESFFNTIGYAFQANPATKPGYSGTLIGVKGEEMKLPLHESFSFSDETDLYIEEGRIVAHDFEEFLLLNLYVPSGSSSEDRHLIKLRFMKSLISMIRGFSKEQLERLILCGDFNICHQDADIHHPLVAAAKNMSGFREDERRLFSDLLDLGLIDVYRERYPQGSDYTWWSYRAGSRGKNLGWRIDYFLLSKHLAERVKKIDILTSIKGSDHCPLVLHLE